MKTRILLAIISIAAASVAVAAPSPDQKAAVSTAGGVMTLKGSGDQTTPPLPLAQGVYIVRRTGGESFLSLTIKDKAGAPVFVQLFNAFNKTFLLIVGGGTIKPGDHTVELSGMDAWALSLAKVEEAGAEALPQVMAGAERATVVSKTFKAEAGELAMTYAYKSKAKGTGTLTVVEVATGKTVPMRQMMYAGRDAGGFKIAIPSAGVYIAQTTFPLASGGGEVKLSQ